MSGRPALFLDRDGVINHDRGFVFKREDFEFVDGIFDVCRAARLRGFAIFVVTNQSGIGRGYYTERDFLELTEWMSGVFRSEGVRIDKVYFCASHPEFGLGAYEMDSPFRKPGPGMILQAADEFDVDLDKSVLVGDRESDMQAALNAGVGCRLLYRPVQYSGVSAPTVAHATITRLVDLERFLH